MSSENHHHYFYHHQNLHIHHHRSSTFLPMLCSRPSIKDVSLPQPGSFSNEPLSPRIGCMGQVKRHNKIVGLGLLSTKSNTTTTNISIISPSVMNYSKLKKLFSAKNLSTTSISIISTSTINATTTAPTASSCGSRPPRGTVNAMNVPRSHRRRSSSRNENAVPLSIENMDPPLPVIKRVLKRPEEEGQVDNNNLWKRRSGGAALKSLQLQQIQHSRHHPQLTSV